MKTSLTLFLFGVGLVLVLASSACAQGDELFLRSGTTARTLNASVKQANFPDGSAGGSYVKPAASNKAYNGTTILTLNTGGATLAGVITLLLLQRRHHTQAAL